MCWHIIDGAQKLSEVMNEKDEQKRRSHPLRGAPPDRLTVIGADGEHVGVVLVGYPFMRVFNKVTDRIVAWISFPDDNTKLTEMLARRELWHHIDEREHIRFSAPLVDHALSARRS